MVKRCESCALWKQGDPSVIDIRNSGVCTAFMPVSMIPGSGGDVFAKGVPAWARGLAQRTLSFAGTHCDAWKEKSTTK